MRAVRLVVVLVVAMSVLAPGPSDVAEAQTTAAGLCNSDSVTQFSDVGAGDYGAEYILCMKALGVSLGRADGSYGADLELTQGADGRVLGAAMAGRVGEAVSCWC